MKEHIEREALLELYQIDGPENETGHVPLPVIRQNIMDLPAADVAEVRHGRWIFEPGKIPYCSECKEYSDDGDKGATFCPWCGVRMDKEAEHE